MTEGRMTGRETLFNGLAERLGRAIRRQSYPNYFWELSWDITYVCNARCSYCSEPRASAHPDVGPALERILRLRPKFIQVVGGEPLLVPGIEEHLRRIKGEINPAILLITNMTVDDRVLQAVAPHVDVLLVSLDGLGEFNRMQRGVDGFAVLDKMVRFSNWLKSRGMKRPVMNTSTVITRQSLDGLLDLGRRMREVLPEAVMGPAVASPYWHELSIGHDRILVGKLLATLEAMRREGLKFNFADGAYPESPGSLDAEGIFPRTVRCKRQFFRANVFPDGSIAACKPWYYDRCFVPRMREYLRGSDYRNLSILMYRAIEQFLLNKQGTTCCFPCKCTMWLDELLNAGRDDVIPTAAGLIAGKFSEAEIREANAFLERSFGAGMGKGLCRYLVNGDG